jgi:transposase InsO family protein
LCADITYIPMRRGFLYLVAVTDWSTRKVLSWRVSNTMDGEFCIEALEEALSRFGRPEIYNTDQGWCRNATGRTAGRLDSVHRFRDRNYRCASIRP